MKPAIWVIALSDETRIGNLGIELFLFVDKLVSMPSRNVDRIVVVVETR